MFSTLFKLRFWIFEFIMVVLWLYYLWCGWNYAIFHTICIFIVFFFTLYLCWRIHKTI